MFYRALVLALFVAGSVCAQRDKIVVNTETPEGQLLQQIGQESDDAKKLGLLEQFAGKYPKHESAGWVYAQMQTLYMKASQFDKAMEAGDKLFAIDPSDVETALQNLKASEGKTDPDLVKKWSATTAEAAGKVVASQKPKEEDAVDEWTRKVDYAKQVKTYTDYSLYAMALQLPDPQKKIEFIEELTRRSPESEYVPKLTQVYFTALRQAGQNERAVAVAEKILETDQNNEDMLLVVADSYFQKKQQPEKVFSYTGKMIEVVGSKPKPEGVSDADWTKKKNLVTGLGHWMQGKLYFGQNKFVDADKSLQAALPFIESNADLKADALFHLGVANFKLGSTTNNSDRILAALKFSQACAAMKSPYQGAAQRNVNAIKSQYRVTR